MIFSIVFRFFVLSLVFSTFAPAQTVRFRSRGKVALLESKTGNVGLVSPVLGEVGWKSVNVNADEVLAYKKDCKTATKPLAELTEHEKAAIEKAKKQIKKYDPKSAVKEVGVKYAEVHDDKLAVKRLALVPGFTGFVYLDDTVFMKPNSCLSPDEIKLCKKHAAKPKVKVSVGKGKGKGKGKKQSPKGKKAPAKSSERGLTSLALRGAVKGGKVAVKAIKNHHDKHKKDKNKKPGKY